jgi:hypothetical protein
MAYQNINQYVYQKYRIDLEYDSMDMSLASDERDYSEEVVFSPFIIAETYGKKLPININIDDPYTAQPLNLSYKHYNQNNVFISQNYYNPNNENINCFTAGTSCDIGLTGIDNGLVNKMTGETINFTEGIFEESVKFDRMHYDRRFKMIQVTGYTGTYNRFSGVTGQTLYEVVSKQDPTAGLYHELYGGFYQGFYKLHGYDYEILPERVTKGWSVEMVLKPRLKDDYSLLPNETTLNKIYPQNKNTFFYLGTRAENKFYHHADGHPNCYTGYTRVTTPLANCLQTCACCDRRITNSRCIYVYPPRSKDGKHDPHVNYGCDKCGGKKELKLTCGCNCNDYACESCGWECFTHNCDTIIEPTPTPTPTPSSTPTCQVVDPICTPTCTPCVTCTDCATCGPTGYTSIEDTCEKDPLWDSLSNAISLKLCGDPKNPSIGVKVLRFTGDCTTTGTCITGQTFVTGYTIQEYCSPPIYPRCEKENPAWLNLEHWFQVDVVWRRYTNYDFCDLKYFGGLADITETKYLESLANNTVALIAPPYTKGEDGETIEIIQLNDKWLLDKKDRLGRLKIYVNGKPIYTLENFEEVIPRALNTDKERQLAVPFNISWGGGTQGLHENLTFSSCSALTSNYIQDPECFPNNILSATTLSGISTNILLEQNFGGTFEGGISQFRMYVEPLTGDEIKHNFDLLKDKFRMFDPDCPDCGGEFCETDDFDYVIGPITTTTTTIFDTNLLLTQDFESLITQGGDKIIWATPTPFLFNFDSRNLLFGRQYIYDERDKKYLITDKFGPQLKNLKPSTNKYWFDDGWWGDQKNTPQCVGYAWAHWLEDGPIEQSGIPPIIPPSVIYQNAQKLDEWPGEKYDGTSVRGAVKYLQNVKKVSSYYWAYDLQTLITTVLNLGPVVVGTNWYEGMFYPNVKGIIRATGRLAGGHAYVINGVDTTTKMFRIKNSWGRLWGQKGHAYISFVDMQRLIREQGEICLAKEIKT